MTIPEARTIGEALLKNGCLDREVIAEPFIWCGGRVWRASGHPAPWSETPLAGIRNGREFDDELREARQLERQAGQAFRKTVGHAFVPQGA
jgi:hypothetical protein